ncbi:transcription termination factor Rho [Kribbella voronezhensis]|uniref:Transcription termination factor Rho n=1 Tax=Kribbella voronezhensis TaxID=2512212 RepID=A0A4R7STV8_9ACTN|nr:transcription termination factor Rho [Kribbella voronezhensis]TDU82235.1 transcription termination factor Rho [Kribbella voronezhensis]
MTETVEASSGAGTSPADAGATTRRRKAGGGLEGMLLPELKQLAGTLGIKGTGALRKGQLIEAIKAAQSGAGAAGASRSRSSQPTLDEAAAEPVAVKAEAPARVGTRRARAAAADSGAAEKNVEAPAAKAAVQDKPAQNSGTQNSGTQNSGTQNSVAQNGVAQAGAAPVEAAATAPVVERHADADAESRDDRSGGREGGRDRSRGRDNQRTDRDGAQVRDSREGRDNQARDGREAPAREGREAPAREVQVRDGRDAQARDARDGQSRDRNDNRDRNENRDGQNRDGRDGQNRDSRDGQNRDGRNDGRGEQNRDNRGEQRTDGARGDQRTDRQSQTDRGEDGDGRRRRRRGRDRDRGQTVGRDSGGRDNSRNNRGRGERFDPEPTISEDDILVPAAGILDVLDNYAFVRTSGYLPGPNDVYVALSMVKRYGLRKGDAITGAVKQPSDGERKEKFNPLVRIDTVNGSDPEVAKQRQDFNKLTPLYATERLRLETEPNVLTTRIVDIVSPIGKGQRGLIVSPPKAGKTMVLQALANAITTNNPEVHLMVVLVDERPEEVTDMQRTVKGEVIASTFDRPADDHTTVAELAIERAKRLVELGHDVVVLLDSITRLGRAYNIAAPASGRILSGGVDSSALYPPKRFFGAARNIEDGGSLTILATALIETGSKMDEVIFEEFKGTGNMELRLRREFADRRIFPAIDVVASGTRREELLMSKDETQVVWKLRRVLSALDGQAALELLIGKLKESKSNIEFLLQVNKTTPSTGGTGRSTDDGN